MSDVTPLAHRIYLREIERAASRRKTGARRARLRSRRRRILGLLALLALAR
jgi:hypothetical protein